MKRYIFAGALITTLILAFWGVGIGASARELDSVASRFSGASSPSEVIQLVNQLRKANGLPAYQVNSALMAAAQAHSEYQAAVGSVTHTGSGGSRPRDRAIAMGYGGGGAVFVTENIMGGNSMTAQKAVQWWQGDAPHLNTMLSSNYQDVGAGVAVSGSAVYITLDVGYIAGAAPPPPTDGTVVPGNFPTATPAPTLEIIIPVAVATPKPDGSIIHEVQQGQTLWIIADTYKVDLSVILALNGLTQDSVIFPGEKLLLKAAHITPTIEPSVTTSATKNPPSATVTLSATVPSSRTPTTTESVIGLGEATPVALALLGEESLTAGDSSRTQNESLPLVAEPQGDMHPILVVIAVLVVMGTALLLVGSLLRREA
jgi:LysM repeat protein